MFCTDKEALDEYMKNNLKPSRFTHSLGVEKMAVKLAQVYGAPVDKAAFAGRYHDIAKCFDVETMNEYIRKYNIPERYLNNTPLAHSKVATEILRREFGVKDEDILNAVSSHTTGRAGMSILEQIVFVSDAIEENRNYPGLKRLQELALTDLDAVSLEIFDFTVESIEKQGRALDTETLEAREYIKNLIERRQ